MIRQSICAILFVLLLTPAKSVNAQSCDCEKEFLHIKSFIEENYAGYPDKLSQLTKSRYGETASRFQSLSRDPSINCLLLISQFLDVFEDDHLQVGIAFDATKADSVYIGRRQPMSVTGKKFETLSREKGIEGIYLSNFDSAYRIAVIKDKTPLRDYIGIILDSKLNGWKKGLVKFEARQLNDSMLKGILYMRNHMPKVEWFFISRNRIGGDWQREGTVREKFNSPYVPVASEKPDDSTLYIKISSFSPGNAKLIDSVFRTHRELLGKLPYLVLDLRDNGGGSDFAFNPILPYIYTQPVKGIGVDVLATKANIDGWKKLLSDEELPEDSKDRIRGMIAQMEANPGQLVSIAEDYIDSSLTPFPNPRKVIVLINNGCASTTEQFLLYARQSTKVILMGQPTQGTLDYSNMREAPFSCMPYTLRYPTTRSRRLDVGEGIDQTGILPDIVLDKNADWFKEAMKKLRE